MKARRKPELIEADAINYEEFARSQREAFARLLQEMGASDSHMVPSYYRWKYHPPTGKARIAVIYEGEEILASVAMMPLTMRYNNSSIRAWQFVDTATVPKAGGKGYFKSTGAALINAVPEDELSFGFPNKNVTKGWTRLGWEYKQLITTWVCPGSVLFQWEDSRAEQIGRFDERQDAFVADFKLDKYCMVERSSAYMNWRYIDHPLHEYTAYSLVDAGEVVGTVVACVAKVMNRRVMLVLDLLGTKPRHERALLRRLCSTAAEKGCAIVAHLDNACSAISMASCGFLPVWSRLLPKEQVVMGKPGGGRQAQSVFEKEWRMQLGDWDVF